MKRAVLGVWLAIAVWSAPAWCETREVHGADSSFRSGAVGICWGMLRGAPGEDVQVVIRIRLLAEGEAPYAQLSVEAVHPLTRAAETVVSRRPLERTADVTAPRESFKNLTGRRIAFYDRTDPQPRLVVFYNGVPDTTPELPDRDRLEQYFEIAFKRLAQQKTP
jgi:hypothetical protein